MSADIKEDFLNWEIMSGLIYSELVFLRVYKNLIVLSIFQDNNLVGDRIDNFIKKIGIA